MIIEEQVQKDIIYNVLTKNEIELDADLMEKVCSEIVEELESEEEREKKEYQDIIMNKEYVVSKDVAIQIAMNHYCVSRAVAERYTDSELKEALQPLRLHKGW